MPPPVAGVLALYNLAALLCYGVDKAKAKSGGMRMPEVLLHLLALSGAPAGCALGRALFDHKTAKPFFGVVQLTGAVVAAWLSRI